MNKPIKILITIEKGKIYSIKATEEIVVVSHNNDWQVIWLPPVNTSEDYRQEIEEEERLARELGFSKEQIMQLKK